MCQLLKTKDMFVSYISLKSVYLRLIEFLFTRVDTHLATESSGITFLVLFLSFRNSHAFRGR